MYPANQYMDPYFSYHRDGASYPYHPCPGWEVAPPPVRMDSLMTRPPNFGFWPHHGGKMSHANPHEFHGCCNHTYPPGYYSFRPPFPHDLPPPHLYYHGPFPPHPNAYPSYFVPPPAYAYQDDQAPYGYDKSKNHCCGCSNHVCHGGKNNSVKIEEGLEGKQKNADDPKLLSCSDYGYPMLWLPSGSMKEEEHKGSPEVQPRLQNGWIPVNGEKPSWPIIWMPGYDEAQHKAKDVEKIEASPRVSEEAPSSPRIKIIPLPFFENGHHDQKTSPEERSAGKNQSRSSEHSEAASVKVGNYKTIPVVHKKESDEDKLGADERKEERKQKKESTDNKPCTDENKEEKKASNAETEGDKGTKHHTESSKAKHLKLPPVCLRVDPLPRKKSGNGSSRSPSPPSHKDRERAEKDSKESKPKKEIKVVRVESGKEAVPVAPAKGTSKQELYKSMDDQKEKGAGDGADMQENVEEKAKEEGSKKIQHGEGIKGEDKKSIIIMSEAEAAVRIQSAYRGYDVRRWKPLEKLRRIKNVREQMLDLKRQLQSLEDSSKQAGERERVAVGEAIMNVLLKLDTIQGLHPSVREARKCLARELTCLQEKLDSLGKQTSVEPPYMNVEEAKSNKNEQANVALASVPAVGAPQQGKPAVQGEGQESPSKDSAELRESNDSSGESRELKHEGAPTEQVHEIEESKNEVSAAAMDDSGVPSTTASLQNGPAPDHEYPAEGQAQEPSTEQEHQEEAVTTLVPAATVEDAAVPSNYVHFAPADEPTSPKPRVESTRVSEMEQQQVTGVEANDRSAIRDPGRAPETTYDGTSNIDVVIGDDTENSSASTETAREEQVKAGDESKALQCEIDNPNEPPVEYPTESYANQEEPLILAPEDEAGGAADGAPKIAQADGAIDAESVTPETLESEPVAEHPIETSANEEEPVLLASKEEADGAKIAEPFGPGIPESEPMVEHSIESSANEEEDSIVKNAALVAQPDSVLNAEPIRRGSDGTEASPQNDDPTREGKLEMQVSPVNHTRALSDEGGTTDKVDVTEGHAAEAVANSSEDVALEINKVTELPNEAEVDANAADASSEGNVQREAPWSSDEKKLAEENEKLREMLQKLLEAGKDQLGVITELSDKVKALERKLAHKKRARVGTHRAIRHAAAKAH